MNTQTTHKLGDEHMAKGFVVPAASLVALLSASCCVLPIGFSILGLGGSWLLILEPFVAYREVVVIVVAIALTWAWYRVLKPKNCVKPKTSVLIWVLIGAISFLIAASSPIWEEHAARFMWGLFRSAR